MPDTFVCTWVKANNGIVQALFTRTGEGQQETVLVNLVKGERYEVGKSYAIAIAPAGNGT